MKIFISYPSEERELAERVSLALELTGVVLLVFSRTALVGALLLFGALTNVLYWIWPLMFVGPQ